MAAGLKKKKVSADSARQKINAELLTKVSFDRYGTIKN
jgi:hypothetical protein